MSQIESVTSFDPLQYLPNEICVLILEHLDPISLATVGKISRCWKVFSSLDCLWRTQYTQASWYSTMPRSVARSSRCSGSSWKSAFAARRSLEMRWNAGNFNTFALKVGFQVTSMRMHGQNLFTGDTMGTILCWDLITHKLVGLPLYQPECNEVRCIELDLLYPDILICGHRNGFLSVWHFPSRRILRRLDAHNQSIETIRVNDHFIITASMDNTIKVWTRTCHYELHGSSTSTLSTPTRCLKLTWTLRGHTALVSALSISTNPNMLISSSPIDKTIRTWDLATGYCTSSLTCPDAVACSHLDGQRLSVNNPMSLWDEAQAKQVGVLQDPDCVTLGAQGLWRDGRLQRLVTVGSGGCTLWEWKEEAAQWMKLYCFMDGSAWYGYGRESAKKQALRYCQVDERRVVCCSGPTVFVWDFAQSIVQSANKELIPVEQM